MLLVSVCPAIADAIDGQWCLGASHFEINGPNIRTPGGNDNHRQLRPSRLHLCRPAERGRRGHAIVMALLNEETVRLTRGTSAPETWKRCKPVS